jgi:hypothetical protein
MKHYLGFLGGVLLGVAVAVGVLYLNPLTQRHGPVLAPGDRLLTYEFPLHGTLAFTHGVSWLPRAPAGIAPLWEETISDTALSVFPLHGEDGETVALASRISVPSESSELLLRGAILSDYWVVTFPGEGSLFLRADENLWPFIRDTVLPVRYLGREWRGPTSYRPTSGPGAGGAATVIGATGALRDMRGKAAESYTLEAFSPGAGLQRLSGKLALRLPLPSPGNPEKTAEGGAVN